MLICNALNLAVHVNICTSYNYEQNHSFSQWTNNWKWIKMAIVKEQYCKHLFNIYDSEIYNKRHVKGSKSKAQLCIFIIFYFLLLFHFFLVNFCYFIHISIYVLFFSFFLFFPQNGLEWPSFFPSLVFLHWA